MPDRRSVLKQGVIAGGVIAGGGIALGPMKPGGQSWLISSARADDLPPSPIPNGWKPFTTALPVPPVLQPAQLLPEAGSNEAQLGSDAVYHGIAQEFYDPRINLSLDAVPVEYRTPLTTYQVTMQETDHPMFGPDFPTVPMFGYNGTFPGPTVITRFKQPVVIRQTNHLEVETSVHLHGGHNPAHSDGFPNFYVLPHKSRDYFYTNIAPREDGDLSRYDNFDESEAPSTLWYHDHGMDITGFNCAMGLAGFYLMTDPLEESLMDPNRPGGQVLPNLHDPAQGYGKFDIPLALMDERLNPDGTIAYDFLDHNGRLGDIFTVNGAAQPVLKVQRRKYRFRILNASNARWYTLRLSKKQHFLLLGSDSWLLPNVQKHRKLTLSSANRRDVIIDFSNAPDVVYLENIMEQEDGRGPDGINARKKVRLMKFEVEPEEVEDNLVVAAGTPLRPFAALKARDVQVTREFEFDRRNGAWQINKQWFSPRRADAVPALEQTERWILKNGGGGWAHPIHIHLSATQLQKINGRRPKKEFRYNTDTTQLMGGDEAEILIRFSTFTGPFVFHCHTLEHEDMRMMGVFDPQPDGQASPMQGFNPIAAEISGLVDPEPEELFAEAGQVDLSRLEGDGVGVPPGDYEPGGGGVAPSPADPDDDDD